MLIDGHCHLAGSAELAQQQQKYQILTILNCESPEEWEENRRLTKEGRLQMLSFGVHPWKADRYQFEEVLPYLEKANIIGEIGLDNVWTQVPMSRQLTIFEQQLAYAMEHQKPVVLHTKGCEAEILSLIKKYPNRYLIHWYSSMALQEAYIELGCYFTIGIDLMRNHAVKELAKKVPLDRLLIETDGLAAIEWALGQKVKVEDYVLIVTNHLQSLAELRTIKSPILAEKMAKNLQTFLNGKI
ncbi:TatD family hydrolase [Candidatus Enterococcus courvalinii]|uniref:TatD family hydrolase n=1 Tax=Candidatus Enterococcus courvalinii TaxID=2815329 RepID=A0ABS3I038_9ENTE|nr:TatD family hydrolase [Enterococcus sp. MSG2901]MBO0482073.1 TatD family hydrolase [Enterococcus sp. MSG2901]